MDLNYQTATKHELWELLKQRNDTCDGGCSNDARKNVKYIGNRWMFVPHGSGYGVGGPVIKHCPYCGKVLSHGETT